MQFSPRSLLLAIAAVGAFPALVRAQTQVLVFDTRYVASNLSQWGTGGAGGTSYNINTGVNFGTSANFGGFGYGLFGEEYGAGGTASINGNVGFNVGFAASGGSVDINLPNKIRISAPADVNALTPTLSFTQDRSAIGSGDFLTSRFDNLSFNLGGYFNLDARIDGRIAYGVGSTSGSITMEDLFAVAFPTQAAVNEALGISPFHVNLNNLLGYNSATNTLTVAGQAKDISNGVPVPINSDEIARMQGQDIGTKIRLGTVTINPSLTDLNANSGSSLTSTNVQGTILGASLDILGAFSAGLGFPANPYDVRATIPETSIDLRLMSLSLNPYINVGLKQTLTLSPRTYVGLSSNYDVKYEYTDATGTHTVTTKDLLYLLPNDGSASTLKIIERPAEGDWQLFSRVFVDPQLLNQLYLQISAGVDIRALAAELSAYGTDIGFGPLIDEDLKFGDLSVLIYSALFNLQGGNLSRVYRNPIPLFGTGVVRNLIVEANDDVQFFGQSGSFDTGLIDGNLTLRDATFINTVPLTINGQLHLDATSHNTVDMASSTVLVPELTVSATGTLRIDGNSELIVTGRKTVDGAGAETDVLDAYGNRIVGFINPTAPDAGEITTGTYLLGGTLSYDGPQITGIGAGAHIELLPSDTINGTDLGRRFNNYHGAADPADAIDGLRSLRYNQGTLIVAGQNLDLTTTLFNNSGTLTVKNGFAISAPNAMLINPGGKITIGAGSQLTVGSWSTANLTSGGTLQDINFYLSGVFRYTGSRANTLAANTILTLSGARPDGGYVQATVSSTPTDGLGNVVVNQGTFSLADGATQTIGGSNGGLNNSGTVNVSASTLAVTGDLTNSGTINLTDNGTLTLTNGGTINNISDSTLAGGVWNLGGALTYGSNASISRIAGGTSVTLSGGSSGFFNSEGNAFSVLNALEAGSSLSLLNGATLTSSGILAIEGSLNLSSGANLTLGGLSAIAQPLNLTGGTLTTGSLPLVNSELSFAGALTLAGTLNYSGEAVTGIASGTTIHVGAGGTFRRHGGNGWATLASVSGTLNLVGGTVRTDVSFTLPDTSSAVLNLGAGSTFQAAGATLTLNPNGQFNQNGGTLGLGGGSFQTALTLDRDFTFQAGNRVNLGVVEVIDNYAVTTGSGQLVTTAGHTLTNSASILGAGDISGGMLINRGSIRAGGGTLTLRNLEAPLINTGILGAFGNGSASSTLRLDGITVNNTEAGVTAVGSLQVFSTLSLVNGATINGGSLLVFHGGRLEAEGATMNVGTLNLDGTFAVANGAATQFTGALTVNNSGSLWLETADGSDSAAVLAFGHGSTMTNRGTITFGAGAQMTNITLQNLGSLNLAAGLTNLSNVVNGIGGTINLLNGSTLNLATTHFSNGGLIHLSGEAPPTTSHSTFLLTDNLELTGGGTIQLGGYNTSVAAPGGGRNAVIEWTNAGTGTLTGTAGQNYKLTLTSQQIIGTGTFGDGQIWIENQAGGTIGAYGEGQTMTIATTAYNAADGTGGFLNFGTLDVGTGATMRITGDFRSLDAQNALATGAYRIGGTLQIDRLGATTSFNNKVAITFDGTTARLANADGATVNFLNNQATGSIAIANGAYTIDTGASPFTNEGLLRAAFGGTLGITGGNFTNFAGSTLTGGRYDVMGTLKFDGADIITLADASLTLRGNGQVTNATGDNALTGLSTLTHAAFSLQNNAVFTLGAGVTNFTNTGSAVTIAAGSTLDLLNASVTNIALNGVDASYWIGGNFNGSSLGLGSVPANAHYIFYGTSARINGNANPLPGAGRLTLAGGAVVHYGGGTLTNSGRWEIGSPSVLDPNGNLVSSGAFVSFTGTADTPTLIQNSGTIRYFGVTNSPTEFSVNHLKIESHAVNSIVDLNGDIYLSEGGVMEIGGVLTNSLKRLTFANWFGARGSVVVRGGLDLSHDLSFGAHAWEFTHLSGYRMASDGVTFAAPNLDLSEADVTLRNGGLFINSTTGLSALTSLQALGTNYTMTFDAASGRTGGATNTFANNFSNYGSVLVTNNSDVRFGGSLENHRSIVTANGGHITVAGDFQNGAVGESGAQFSGFLDVGGNLANEANASMTLTGGTVGGMFINTGSFTISSFNVLKLGGVVQNYGTLSFAPQNFRTLDGVGYAAVTNLGTLKVSGTIYNAIDGYGAIHTSGNTQFATANQFTGAVTVDSGKLTVTDAAQLGTAYTGDFYRDLTLSNSTTLELSADLGPRNVNFGSDITLIGGAGARIDNVTAHGTLNVRGTFGVGSLSGPGVVHLGTADARGYFTLSRHGTFQGLTGSGEVTLAGAGYISLPQGSTLTGAINLTSALSSLDVGGSIFTPNVRGVAESKVSFSPSDLVYSGIISGATSVTVESGALTFDHLQAYTGLTTINSGASLTFSTGTGYVYDSLNATDFISAAPTGGVSGAIVNHGELIFNLSTDVTLGASSNISGSGSITQAGSGRTTATSSSFLNNLKITAGTFVMGDGTTSLAGDFLGPIVNHSVLVFNGVGEGHMRINGTGRIDVLGAANLTFTLGGSGSGLNHSGSGIVTLANNSTFTGPYSVTQGTLRIEHGSALGLAPGVLDSEYLKLGAGSTLQVDGLATLSANQGIRLLGDATIATNGHLVIPTISGSALLTKSGLGTLDMGASSLALNATAGATIIRTTSGGHLMPSLAVATGAQVRFADGGLMAVTAVSSGINGHLIVDAGTTLNFSGNFNAPADVVIGGVTAPDMINGTVALAGNFVAAAGSHLHRVAGTGTFSTGDALTVGTLDVGTVNLNGGNLSVTHYDADTTNITAPAAVLTVDSGRTGALNLSYDTTFDVGSSFSINGPLGAATLTKIGAGSLIVANAGTTHANFVLNDGYLYGSGRTTLTGIISGAGGFGVLDPDYIAQIVAQVPHATPSRVILTNDHTFTGGTVISSGELTLGNGGPRGSVLGNVHLLGNYSGLMYDRAGDFTLPNTITGLGYFGQRGTGTLIINSAVNGSAPDAALFTGQMRISTGTIRLDDGAAGFGVPIALTNSTVALSNQGTLALNNSAALAVGSDISGQGTVRQTGSGTSTLSGENNFDALAVTTGKVVLTHANTVANTTISSGATLSLADGANVGNIQRNGSLTGAIANSGTLSLDRSGDYANAFTATGSGVIVQNGSGTAYLAGATQSNRLTVNSGRLATIVANNETTSLNGLLTLAAGASFINYGGGTVVLNAGASGAGFLDANSGVTRLAGGSFTTDIQVGATLEIAQDMGFAKTISGANGTVSLVDSTLTLLGHLNVGTTTIDPTSQLGLNNGSTLTGRVVNNGLISFDYSFGNDTTFANTISGTGAFEQNGSGKVTITGINTATGGATIAANRTLALAGEGSIGGLITNHGTLEIITTTGTSRTLPGNITGEGTLALSGAGTVVIGGDLSNNATLSGGVTLQAATFGTNTFSNGFNGTGNLEVSGSGTLVLAFGGTLAGNAIIGHGSTLQIGDGGANGFLTATQLINHGTLAYNVSSGNTIDTISGTGGIRQMGAGSLTIRGDNPDLVGDTTVDATRFLTIGNADGSAGSVGGALIVNGTLFYNRTGDVTLAQGLHGASTGAFSLGYSGNLTLAGPLNFGGTLNLAGRALTVNSDSGYSFAPGRYAAALGTINASSLTVGGSGSLAILGDNSSSAMTVTNHGTLILGDGDTSGSVGRTIANYGQLYFNRSDNVTAGANSSTAITGGQALVQIGSGILTVGAYVDANSFIAENGTLLIRNTSSIGHYALQGRGAGTLQFESGTFANQVSGRLATIYDVTLTNQSNAYTGAITLGGDGSLTLSGANGLTLGGALLGTGDLHFVGTGGNEIIDQLGSIALVEGSLNTGTITTNGRLVTSGGSLLSNINFTRAPVAPGPGTAGAQNLVVLTNTGAATVGGVFTNASELRLTGSGAVTLAGNYGVVNVLNGSLSLNAGAALTSLSLALGTQANFAAGTASFDSLNGAGHLSGAGSLTLAQGSFSGGISGFSSLFKNESGTLTLSNHVALTNGITVNQGSLALLGTTNAFNGATVNSTGALVIAGANSGTGAYVVQGGSLTLGSAASIGGHSLSLQSGGQLYASNPFTLNSLALANTGGTVNGGFTLNNVTGTGVLGISGRVVVNQVSTASQIVRVNSGGTLVLGSAHAINPNTLELQHGAALDVNGRDWDETLNADLIVIANGATAAPVTVSSRLDFTSQSAFSLAGTGSALTFTGTFANATASTYLDTHAVEISTTGHVILDTVDAHKIGRLTVNGGMLSTALDPLTAITTVAINSGGTLQLTGTAQAPAFHASELILNNGTLLNATSGTIALNAALTGTDSVGTASLGGTGDMIFSGSIVGQVNLNKVGSGNLTVADNIDLSQWSYPQFSPRVEIHGGTLTTALPLVHDRKLVFEGAGSALVITNPVSESLRLRGLIGTDASSVLNLGSRNLLMTHDAVTAYAGAVTTTGILTHNAPNGDTAGGSGGTQTYGTLNVGELRINVGDVVVTDALNTNYVTVIASGAAGSLTTTTRGLTAANHAATLDAQLQIQGTLRLSDGAAITGNAGFINLVGVAATLTDGHTATSTLSHLTSNSGQINVNQGATVTGGAAATFTNTGIVGIGPTSRWDGFNVVNNSGLFSWSGYQLTGANQTNARFTSTGGNVEMLNGASFTGTSGSATNNPAFNLTNTAFTTSGAASLTGGLALTGGTFTLGGAGTIGTLNVAGGVVFGGGTNFLWDINHALGTDGVNRDLLTVTAMAGQVDGKITFSGSAANPITFKANNPTGAALINFNEAQPIAWIIATTTDGFSGYRVDQFIVDVSKLFTSYTGNFGIATSGNNLVLQYYQSHSFDIANGNTVVSTPLAAMGDFGGLRKSGAGTLTLATANNYVGVTNLDAGTLVLAADGAIGPGRLNLNGGTLESTAARSLANGLTLSASATIGGAASLTFTGDLISSSGNKTLSISNTGTTTFGAIDLTSMGSGERLTFNTTGGTVKVAGTISGLSDNNTGLTKTGSGSLLLAGANTYSGGTTVSSGTLILGHNGALGTGTLALGTATLQSDGPARTIANGVSLTGNATFGGTGNLTFTAPVVLTGNRTLTFTNTGATTFGDLGTSSANPGGTLLTVAGAGNLTVNGAVSNHAGGSAFSITKTGTGKLTLNGVSTYRGNTTVNGGSVIVNGSATMSAFTVNAGGTLGGSGTIGRLTLARSATLAPGNSPGTLHTDSQIWSAGASYDWQVQDATGLAGTGYDLVSISGSLTIAASSTDRFTLNLLSILGNDTSGNALNFSSALNSSYTIASATGGVIGFDASAFTLNTSGFTNQTNGGFWSIAQSGNSITLNFTAAAIPEPSTYAALAGALVLGLALSRKRSRRAE